MTLIIRTIIYSLKRQKLSDKFFTTNSEVNDNSELFYLNTLYIINLPYSEEIEQLITKIRIFARNPTIVLIGNGFNCDYYLSDISEVENLDLRNLSFIYRRNYSVLRDKYEWLEEKYVNRIDSTQDGIDYLIKYNIIYPHKNIFCVNVNSLSERFFSEDRGKIEEDIMIKNDIAFRYNGRFVVPLFEEKVEMSKSYDVKFENIPYQVFNKLICKVSNLINDDFKSNYFSLGNLQVYYDNHELFIINPDSSERIFLCLKHIFYYYKITNISFDCEDNEMIEMIDNILRREIEDPIIRNNIWIVAKAYSPFFDKFMIYKFFLNRVINYFEDNLGFSIALNSCEYLNNLNYVDRTTSLEEIKSLIPEEYLVLDRIGPIKVEEFEWVGTIRQDNFSDKFQLYIDFYGVERYYYPQSKKEKRQEKRQEKFLCVNFLNISERDDAKLAEYITGNKGRFTYLQTEDKEIPISDIDITLKLDELFFRDGDLFFICINFRMDENMFQIMSKLEYLRYKFPSSEFAIIIDTSSMDDIPSDFSNSAHLLDVSEIFTFNRKTEKGLEEIRSFILERAGKNFHVAKFEELRKEIDFLYIRKEEFSNDPEYINYLLERKEIRDEGDIYVRNSRLCSYLYTLLIKNIMLEYSKSYLKTIIPNNEQLRVLRNFMVKYEIGFYRNGILYNPSMFPLGYEVNIKNYIGIINEKLGINISSKDVVNIRGINNDIKVKLLCRLSKYLDLDLTCRNLLFLEIQSCRFVIYINNNDNDFYIVILNDNYQIISYFFQILRKIIQENMNIDSLIMNIEGKEFLTEIIQSGDRLIDCLTTFYFDRIDNGKMLLSFSNAFKTVELDFVNTLSNYKELFPSGKVLYLITKDGMKVPVSKKEDFFEKWEVLNDLAEPCTEEGNIINKDMKLILSHLVDTEINNYSHYMFGDYREEFTEFKNDFNWIDLIRY